MMASLDISVSGDIIEEPNSSSKLWYKNEILVPNNRKLSVWMKIWVNENTANGVFIATMLNFLFIPETSTYNKSVHLYITS